MRKAEDSCPRLYLAAFFSWLNTLRTARARLERATDSLKRSKSVVAARALCGWHGREGAAQLRRPSPARLCALVYMLLSWS